MDRHCLCHFSLDKAATLFIMLGIVSHLEMAWGTGQDVSMLCADTMPRNIENRVPRVVPVHVPLEPVSPTLD